MPKPLQWYESSLKWLIYQCWLPKEKLGKNLLLPHKPSVLVKGKEGPINKSTFFLLRFIASHQMSSYTVCLEDKARLGAKQRGINMYEGNAGGVGTSVRHVQQKEIHSWVKSTVQKRKLNKLLLQLVKFL